MAIIPAVPIAGQRRFAARSTAQPIMVNPKTRTASAMHPPICQM
jgi:hypothetical protein